MSDIKKISLKPAKCAVDLGDGSERGFYVNQDYILRKLLRPHRAINIMYCYYPLDETWPKRAQDAFADKEVGFAWDYPYDNYFPYLGGLNGKTDGEPFTCMQDIRKHGQDVILTMTVDPHISDEHIKAIAKDLRPYGRLMLRLNHEATGDWFSFTKRASYKEIADFFLHFRDIFAVEAPNVKLILCAGAIENSGSGKLEKEEDFLEAYKNTDIWSIDDYIALNWGWPYEVAEKDNNSHKLTDPKVIYKKAKDSFNRLMELSGGVKRPFVMSELNVDGDVTGQELQAKIFNDFIEEVKKDGEGWFSGFTMYQFRDDGRLGLEQTDFNNKNEGIEQPLLKTYKNIIHDDFFKPQIKDEGSATLPVTLRWGGSEDADGFGMELSFEGQPVFAEVNFEGSLKDANLMMEINGSWIYKAPGATFADLMPAFYNKPLTGPCKLSLNFFAPPADGKNAETSKKDWDVNYYTSLTELPKVRLRFEPVMKLDK
ncbi:MAG: hypothetical protein K6B75_06375 [Lachnospiraceae bacterium]|nr:hypothetical protein [Lachnospiraceae bacterium]